MRKAPLASTSSADNVGKYGTDSTNASDGGPPASGTLAAAIAFLRGSIRTDGANEEIPEWEFAEYQWRCLRRSCDGAGLVASPNNELREGGVEHDVLFDEASGLWYKYTKPNCAGYAVEIVNGDVFMFPAVVK